VGLWLDIATLVWMIGMDMNRHAVLQCRSQQLIYRIWTKDFIEHVLIFLLERV
jgi:hypothetical protein